MDIKIYQINADRDTDRVKFLPHDYLKSVQGESTINASIYDEVFCGDVDCQTLEDIYMKFNTEGHPLRRGHSLSVSDIVQTPDGYFYCDSAGFVKTEFDHSLAQKPDNLMRIVYVEPHRKPFVSEIEPTLKAEQKAVCGLIDIVYNDDGTCIVCNDEAKLIGMEGNRYLDDGHTIIAGPLFVCGTAENDFRGLADQEVERYMDRFAQPEDISQAEVEADMGYIIFSM